jgi:hypothetical protein
MRAALAAFFLLAASAAALADEWQEVKGDHFIVYYKSHDDFAKDVANHSEKYYKQIADDLGYPRYSNFWSWDNRAKIYIYENEDDFRKTTGEKPWSHGMASYANKEIHTFRGDDNFVNAVLPHEITHLIFRDFVGFKGEVPLWLDEGVAQWEEPAKREMAFKVARWLVHEDKDYPIQDLMAKDIRKETDQEKVDAFYMQSVTLVDFLIKNYGNQRFTEFCRQLGEGKTFDAALQAAYPGTIESLFELDRRWREYVAVKAVRELEVYN